MYENINIPISVKDQFDLTGQKAVITGGAGFLGLQFAEAIAEMGGTPLLVDFNKKSLKEAEKRLEQQKYKHFNSYDLDITNEAKCRKIYKQIWDENNGVDILINCVALTTSAVENFGSDDFFESFENLDQNIWELGLKINLTSIQLSCKLIGRKMAKGNGGKIINIASDVGVISPNQNIYKPDEHGYEGVDFNTPVFYSVSKAGVIHLTKYLATYWAKNNIRVNCVSPAGVYRNHKIGFLKKLGEQIPMGRMALPNEFKGAIIFLASEASSFVTGHNLIIDGGRTIW